jgi:hypothetical protein
VSAPPRSAFAAITRDTVEEHREWDSPHSFLTLRWDGDSLSCRTWVCIMPDVDPVKYPAVMMGTVREELEKYPDDPAYGYLLQGEFFGTEEPGADASAADREQYERDRIGRTFQQRPDAAEACIAWAADIHGRLWSAAKTRTNPDRIQEAFYQPGRAPRGQMIRGLLTVAYATGVIGHGMPGPQGPLN